MTQSEQASSPNHAHLLEEAAEWLLRHQEGPLSDAEIAEFKAWRQRSSAHEHAWQKAEQLAQRLQCMPPDITRATLNARGAQRRATLTRLALLIGLVPLGWAGWSQVERHFGADYATQTGERRQIKLNDGTRLWLNTRTRLDVTITTAQRHIHLYEGELNITTSADPRPMKITTTAGTLQPLGTVFTVREAEDYTQVGVTEGRVAISLHNGQQHLVPAGQQLRFNATRLFSPNTYSKSQEGWIQGMIIADNQSLEDFVHNLSRYHRGWFRVSPELAALKISGSYPITPLDQTLNMLARTYPVQISRSGLGYLTTFTRKATPGKGSQSTTAP
ncbi:hypothetical protein BFW38_05340 [Terasakiispira papahanaumokuakeensis]|uniref:FecR protein domain-containing protein n=1 Tax=Terasakiispira papahanaumokuakeensis TaxID=197479 RepID=A0A1E2V889_9GAMM|nr:FecR family protein [Terasakiispira papahanaumokuakeensis]ODC03056.1 hypothetical protein BFW38_05340 [Terasakiispira papahanaumokuakeensis]